MIAPGKYFPVFMSSVALLLLSVLVSACSAPSYYVQAISGQWKMMRARQDTRSLLADPDTSPALASQLETARQIIEFAETSLDLPANGSYASYVQLDNDAIAWNVVATEEFSLQPKKWCFPVAGCLPYRGFFKQAKAENSAAKLAKKGMDVFVSPAPAYSTLGKLNDPLLSTMFAGSNVQLAAYLFHELAHQRLYIKNDGRFNENYAGFVETAGVKAWLKARQQQDELAQWERLNLVEDDFSGLINQTRDELTTLYAQDNSDTYMRRQKADTLLGLKDRYKKMLAERWQGHDYYASWFEKPVNNARLSLFSTYEGGQCAFRNLMSQADGNIYKFHSLAEKQAKLPKDEREKWLNQTCPVIASASNL